MSEYSEVARKSSSSPGLMMSLADSHELLDKDHITKSSSEQLLLDQSEVDQTCRVSGLHHQHALIGPIDN
jgi:hypothetical protein